MHTTKLDDHTAIQHNGDWSGTTEIVGPAVAEDHAVAAQARIVLSEQALAILVVSYMAEKDNATKALHMQAFEHGLIDSQRYATDELLREVQAAITATLRKLRREGPEQHNLHAWGQKILAAEDPRNEERRRVKQAAAYWYWKLRARIADLHLDMQHELILSWSPDQTTEIEEWLDANEGGTAGPMPAHLSALLATMEFDEPPPPPESHADKKPGWYITGFGTTTEPQVLVHILGVSPERARQIYDANLFDDVDYYLGDDPALGDSGGTATRLSEAGVTVLHKLDVPTIYEMPR